MRLIRWNTDSLMRAIRNRERVQTVTCKWYGTNQTYYEVDEEALVSKPFPLGASMLMLCSSACLALWFCLFLVASKPHAFAEAHRAPESSSRARVSVEDSREPRRNPVQPTFTQGVYWDLAGIDPPQYSPEENSPINSAQTELAIQLNRNETDRYKNELYVFKPPANAPVFVRNKRHNLYHWHKSCPVLVYRGRRGRRPVSRITMTRAAAERANGTPCYHCIEIEKTVRASG